ncbi:MAG: hybrid sensor histidine kinase/response regulator [Chloroflexota bacterium]
MVNSKTILLIDDEPAFLKSLSAVLRRNGYQIISTNNGKDGLTLIRSEHPDLIISDVMMPQLNGFEVRNLLSQDPEVATIPFIFLSARADVQDRIHGIRQGADDYITKPFEVEELLARIEAIFRRKETEQAHGREQMRQRAAEEIENLRREILQNIHHEFRTPLTNVIMPLQLAISRKFTEPAQQIEFIKLALSNLDKLESLVADFITLTNIDQNHLNTFRQVIDPQIHLVTAINKRLQRYSWKNIKLNIDIQALEEIRAPRAEFIQAVVHLADNAFKFSPQFGKVDITIKSSGGGGASVQVQDEGQGIPPELQEKVFDRFYQISQGDSRDYEGMGVGLTIAKIVAESNGGSIKFIPCEKGCCIEMNIAKGSEAFKFF